jgi:signal peptidase I
VSPADFDSPSPTIDRLDSPTDPARLAPRRPLWRTSRRRPAHKRGGRWVAEGVIIIAVALVVAILLRTFVVQTFVIPSQSMEPTLQVGDRILVNKLSYHLHGVGRGDIVVFSKPPLENCGEPVTDLVKRVIGLPGETISLAHGEVYINGKFLPEPWLPKGVKTYPVAGEPYGLTHPYKIPSGQYFMMGDNRPESCDSRYWGPITRSLIIGKVDVRVWPLSRLAWF